MATRRRRNSKDSDAVLTIIAIAIATPAVIARATGVPWAYIGATYAALAAGMVVRWLQLGRRPQAAVAGTDILSEPAAAEVRPLVLKARRFNAEGLNADILLHYHGSDGHESDRLVTVRSLTGVVGNDGKLQPDHFTGYCHVKKAPRTFLVRNTLRAAEPDTGELIADLSGWLAMKAHVQSASDPEASTEPVGHVTA